MRSKRRFEEILSSHKQNSFNVKSSFGADKYCRVYSEFIESSKKNILKLTHVLFMRCRRVFIKIYLDISSMLKGMVHYVTFCLLLLTMKILSGTFYCHSLSLNMPRSVCTGEKNCHNMWFPKLRVVTCLVAGQSCIYYNKSKN